MLGIINHDWLTRGCLLRFARLYRSRDIDHLADWCLARICDAGCVVRSGDCTSVGEQLAQLENCFVGQRRGERHGAQRVVITH